MNIFRLAAELFLTYLLYKIIFEFILPVYHSTKKIRKQFTDMQEKMDEDRNATYTRTTSAQPETKVKREGDYIDYEEIK